MSFLFVQSFLYVWKYKLLICQELQDFEPTSIKRRFIPNNPMELASLWATAGIGSAGAAVELTLDPRFKYWVLLPISVVMILIGVLRQDIMMNLNLKVKTGPRNKITEQQYMGKTQALIANGTNLKFESFRDRQEYLSQVLASGKYVAKKAGGDDAETTGNPLTDPNMSDAMMGMAKGNLANYIPQTLIMWWVNHFFAGFVLMKLPFPLTIKFKEMLQSGILTADLDPRWVSAISWYFISVVGLNPVYNLLFGNQDVDAMGMLQQQQQQLESMPGAPAADGVMKNLANDLAIAQHESCFDKIEQRVLKLYA
ncbi:LAMI_0G02894g1_1 [Lachancea mirantina]|uniref:ER membrane protein complex subunit 3 n=1 Tax=Lachancea mirantina TaxID=1230905 RepID=A0A1G4K7X8_9SACH|nr:LAMI_0G02894g1_1 [Lachancea mirantina]